MRTRSASTAPIRYRLHNPGRTPVVYDVRGHSLGGGERRVIDSLDSVGQTAVDRRQLIARPHEAMPTPAPPAEPEETL